ncbi:tubulin polymerization-promoting protein family member 2-like isoform X1 [Gigantopelta aegis]|uniref:tubulin polymerization-promoting protein family member 2-like isoform X1 n=1 Tax=Gigantopelta aegis TaxID=1735272 RepID=UPI001B88750B|nr:tubulin polymerization-promoting protein family member 2-like isoform X1 [Gigantopelta aegis]XP_041353970.1 tubulin polymerization-promoting protein family member 2-like isoform X1 [Gigantopelta aegis]XP_041353971.1 tubulin polymerization-promoting protein family member 2-like isoform X1 [Gigantopelta aegis]
MAGFNDHFHAFCNFGVSGPVAGGKKKTITDKNVTKMFKDCKLYGKHLTSTDTDIAFSKYKTQGSKELTLDQLQALMKEVAVKYKKDHKLGSVDEAYDKMVSEVCTHGPGLHHTTGMSITGDVEHMTDTTLYTGSHRERFDESGHGRGAEGRVDIVSTSGYVENYRGEGTYDKTH